MPQNQDSKIKILERQVAELMKWKKERESQQLQFPLDYRSMQAINEGLMETIITRLNVRDVYFQPTTSSPSDKGQVRYFDDLSTQTLRIMTSKAPQDAADVIGSFDLTVL